MPRSKSSVSTESVSVKPSTSLQHTLQHTVQHTVQPSIIQSVKEGFAFGIGSSIARNAIESILNSYQEDTSDLKRCLDKGKSDKCRYLDIQKRQAWTQCMKESKFDDESCNSLFNT
jgi:hypothetical protein